MGESTKIQWADHTFNPWMGCSKVHAGCTNCYAEHALPVAMRQGGKLKWGEVWAGGERVVRADSAWKQPLTWARKAARDGVRRRVFCSSLADVLEAPTVPDHLGVGSSAWNDAAARVAPVAQSLDAARERLWSTIRATAAMELDYPGTTATPRWERHLTPAVGLTEGAPGLDWLLLTKRPENWRLIPEDVRPLVWLGTSISDQKTADEWVPLLLAAQGLRVRFLSLEPVVGPVDLSQWLPDKHRWYMCRCRDCGYTASSQTFREVRYQDDADVECPKCLSLRNDADAPGINWVIVGGESGTKARRLDVAWVESIVEQCREAGVPCFVKQMGSNPWDAFSATGPVVLKDKKGGDMTEWPAELRVRELPGGAP